MPDPQTLPALVRAKYPGVYDDLSDQELDAKVRAKFPGVYDDLPKPSGIATAAQPSLKAPGSGLGQMASALKDVGVGAVKGAAHTALDAAQLIQYAPGFKEATTGIGNAIGGAVARGVYGRQAVTPPVSGQHAIDEARQSTAYTPGNTAQRIGGAIETVGEMAVPVGEGIKAIPTTAKAGALFNEVKAAAQNVPVDTTATEAAAMRVKEAVSRGAGSLPGVVKKFIDRLDEPIRNAGPMMFDESREFASNLGDLTVKDYQSLNATGKAAVVQMWAALAKANADVAYSVGKGAEYAKAMNMYAKAKRMETALATVGAGIKKALPFGLGGGIAGAAYEGAKKLFGGE